MVVVDPSTFKLWAIEDLSVEVVTTRAGGAWVGDDGAYWGVEDDVAGNGRCGWWSEFGDEHAAVGCVPNDVRRYVDGARCDDCVAVSIWRCGRDGPDEVAGDGDGALALLLAEVDYDGACGLGVDVVNDVAGGGDVIGAVFDVDCF